MGEAELDLTRDWAFARDYCREREGPGRGLSIDVMMDHTLEASSKVTQEGDEGQQASVCVCVSVCEWISGIGSGLVGGVVRVGTLNLV